MQKAWVGIVLWLCCSTAWALTAPVTQQTSNGPLVCGSAETYWPSGVKWPAGANRSVVMRLAMTGFPQAGAFAMPQEAARDAIARAMAVWNDVICSAGGSPSIRLELGTDIRESDNSLFESMIWLERSSAAWSASSNTIALTRKTHLSTTQMLLSADILFNGVSKLYRAQGNDGIWYGCDAAASNCFDLTAVLVHELGHVLGFEHVGCSDAILSPTGMPDGTYRLSRHEIAGLCAIYPPQLVSQEGVYCDELTPCSQGMSCRRDPAQSDTRWRHGYCVQTCQDDSSCANGWICRKDGAAMGQCTPGPRFPGLEQPVAAEPVDLCANCSSGADCTSYACAFAVDANAVGRCSKVCTNHGNCPSGFRCAIATGVEGICLPAQQDSCFNRFQGLPVEAKCYVKPNQDNPDGMSLPCQDGLACTYWPNQLEGYCLPKCHATDPNFTCAAGSTCCFGLDELGNCASATATGTAVGGCFSNRRYGDACGEPSQRLCPSNTECISTGHPSQARCFGVCDDQGLNCQANELCVSQEAFGKNVCCASNAFASQNPLATCAPGPTQCARMPGVRCDNDTDCLSGLCLTYLGERACSLPCSDDTTCTGASNAMSRCVTMADGQRCWPVGNPAEPPACATEGKQSPVKKKRGCNNAPLDTFGILLLLTASYVSWRSRRPSRSSAESHRL